MKSFDRRKFITALGLSATATAIATTSSFTNELVENSLTLIPADTPSDIKITHVSTFRVKRAIFIKIETNAGVTGWGEASSNSPMEVVESFILKTMPKTIIGMNPFDTELIWNRLFWENHDLGPSGALSYAIAGIDLALWDIKGKILNQPVYNLLGGRFLTEVPAYCGIPLKGGKIPVEKAVERALKVASLGYKTIKLRMQIREYNLNPIPDPTLRYYEAVRKALPQDIDLFVDPNEGYTASRAIEVGKALQAMGMKYFESPVPRENNKDLAEVVDALDIPVMAGEKCYTRWEFRDLILEGNPDIINPDLIKAGGITEVKRIATVAQIFFKQIVPHNTKPTLGTAAALHLMASISNAGPLLEYVELDTYDEVMTCFDADQHLKLIDGKLRVPHSPGLGMEINEKKLQQIAK
ncbi:mandelate racemase/muconate lactonizing enzyme family protein [Aquimarina celericrescens]|nr:mandelate racemase/muconate lactonizing enzyme family protein [Aquimarina celericrescens]